MNSFFKVIMGIFASLYRLTNGKAMGRMAGLNVLLLTTTGRKTGKQRTTPLGYFEENGEYVIIASNAGFDEHPKWFLNLKSKPEVSIQIKDKKISAMARVTDGSKRKELWAKLIALSPQYAGYATKTKREIPLILLHPSA